MKKGQIVILFIFFISLIILGLCGYSSIPDKQLEGTGFLNNLYRALQLFTISGSWTTKIKELPWQIQVARILAPGLTVFSILFILFEGLRTQLKNFFAGFTENHTIVIGLGDTSWQFVQSCIDSFEKQFTDDIDLGRIKSLNPKFYVNSKEVIVIEKDKNNPYIDECRNAGVCVIIGDGREDEVYSQVGLNRASDIVIFTGDDGQNLEIGLMVRKLSNSDVKIHIHIVDANLDDQLWDYPKFVQSYVKHGRINFFNLYELSARMAFKEYPPDIYADIAGANRVHIAIFGFGHLGEHLLIEAVRICHQLWSKCRVWQIFPSYWSLIQVIQKSRTVFSPLGCLIRS